LIYGVLKMTVGIRLTPQEEMLGPDLVIHRVKGCGQQMGYTESYRGRTFEVNLLPSLHQDRG